MPGGRQHAGYEPRRSDEGTDRFHRRGAAAGERPTAAGQELTLRIEALTGSAIEHYLPALAALRIEVFREWPYLYDGDAGYETTYLKKYLGAPKAVVFAAFDIETVVGASTCLPLADEADNVIRPFIAAGLDPAHYFYFSESVLRPAYRGQGVGVAFFAAREAAAAGFAHTTFCVVERAMDDPRRPPGYRRLNDFWAKRGYREQLDLRCEMAWREVGQARDIPHTLVFWTKPR